MEIKVRTSFLRDNTQLLHHIYVSIYDKDQYRKKEEFCLSLSPLEKNKDPQIICTIHHIRMNSAYNFDKVFIIGNFWGINKFLFQLYAQKVTILLDYDDIDKDYCKIEYEERTK